MSVPPPVSQTVLQPVPQPRARSQVAAGCLVLLDGLEEGLEVAGAEALVVVALDELDEERGTILHRLGEDLQQVPVLVKVNQNAVRFDEVKVLLDVHLTVLEALSQVVVVPARAGGAVRSQLWRRRRGRGVCDYNYGEEGPRNTPVRRLGETRVGGIACTMVWHAQGCGSERDRGISVITARVDQFAATTTGPSGNVVFVAARGVARLD